MISGGVQENLLPQTAVVTVNLRLFPGDTISAVCDRVRMVIADPSIQIKALDGRAIEATTISPSDSAGYHAIEACALGIFGDLPLAPSLVTGMTDARFYTLVSGNVYRFTPLLMTRDDLARVHGVNERIAVGDLVKMAQFYYALLQDQAVL